MNRREWQEELDEMFPAGVRVTRVEDVIEDLSDSFTITCSGLNVLAADEDGCEVIAFPVNFQTTVGFRIESIEAYNNGYLVKTGTEPDGSERQPYYLSNTFGAQEAAELAVFRSREIAWWRPEHPFEEEAP